MYIKTIKTISCTGVAPFTSCNCERGFSLMNLIKNFQSNRMGNDLLGDIMRIKDGEDDCHYDFYLDKSTDITKLFAEEKERKCPYDGSNEQ